MYTNGLRVIAFNGEPTEGHDPKNYRHQHTFLPEVAVTDKAMSALSTAMHTSVIENKIRISNIAGMDIR